MLKGYLDFESKEQIRAYTENINQSYFISHDLNEFMCSTCCKVTIKSLIIRVFCILMVGEFIFLHNGPMMMSLPGDIPDSP